MCKIENDRGLSGCEVYMKCEHLQKTGVILFSVTHSSGNHGQGLAWAASQVGVLCYVAVPRNAPPSKMEAMIEYGAKVELCDATVKSREDTCARLAKDLSYCIVEPFDDSNIICGQGTIGAEIIEQLPDVDAIFLAIGGGGMASGIVAYMNEVKPSVKVFLIEPQGKHLAVYLKSGVLTMKRDVVDTIADGIRVLKIGRNCYPILKSCSDNVITVQFTVLQTDDEIRVALRLIWTRTKQRVEPSAAVPLAGLLKISPSDHRLKKVVLVLCGGNVDLDFVP
ncbi:pyridoxal-phosphate dependent protein [Dictyocaulus viviparus]|uniref:Pyridoxal-phosphate dependent protein n=1 Tax=Dictyocaulus viviparus TaxID=29172 RepID=A0A0D8XH04_DICVI|nr:pyridoxal-phosphate dependent protein [Dictyocaulus viviparus]